MVLCWVAIKSTVAGLCDIIERVLFRDCFVSSSIVFIVVSDNVSDEIEEQNRLK